jgi:hypothetical protein
LVRWCSRTKGGRAALRQRLRQQTIDQPLRQPGQDEVLPRRCVTLYLILGRLVVRAWAMRRAMRSGGNPLPSHRRAQFAQRGEGSNGLGRLGTTHSGTATAASYVFLALHKTERCGERWRLA